MGEVFGVYCDISLSQIDGVPLNDLIDRGYRFNISTDESKSIDFITSTDVDENDEDLIHV